MSNLAGGRADKLGNRYEGRWVAYQLIRLLAGELAVVQLEAVGDDEHGVDVWVTHPGGSREAHQCKRKCRTSGKWGVGELGRQDVLNALADQLRRGGATRFTFVSAIPAPDLRELSEFARTSGGDPEAFFRAALGVKAHADNLKLFCRFVGADPNTPSGRQDAFDLLCRTHTHLFEDSRDGDAMLRSVVRCHVGGDPAAAVEALANFAQERLGQPISIDDVRQHLTGRGFRLVDIAGVPNIGARLDRLRQEFRDSLRHGLALAAPIDRPETDTILGLLGDPARRLIVVHGRAGDGKSTVLLQLTERLTAAGIPFLPLRLDRRPPAVSAERYGTEQCDLPESPAVVLRSVYPDRAAVLILDQLDAIRWTSAHGTARWEACRELIDEALGFSNIVVVVACRSFDLRDDQQIRAWHTERKGHEVVVGELPDASVATAVKTAGGNYEGLTGRQKQLLRSPLQLSLWVQVRRSGHAEPGWNSHADLMREFWRTRYEALDRSGVPAEQYRAAVTALVTVMDRRGELSVPVQTLDPYPKAAAALHSLGVIVSSERRLLFAHQSYFEYLLATRLSEQVVSGQQTVAEWVRSGDQSLLRREQLRLLLTLLRDDRPAVFARAATDIIRGDDVRFHLKQLVLGMLGDVPHPSSPEVDLVYSLVASDRWREHVCDLVVSRQPAWFDALDGRGVVEGWLAGGEETTVHLALRLCNWVAEARGDRVAELLRPYATRPDPWPQRVSGVLPFSPEADSDALFALRLSLIRAGHTRHRFLTAERLADSHPDRCVSLLEAFFEAPRPGDGADRPRRPGAAIPYWIEQHEVQHLTKVADAIPETFWRRLVPHVIRVSEQTRIAPPSSTTAPPFYGDSTWPEERGLGRYEARVELLRLVAHAGAALVTRDPEGFRSSFGHWLAHAARSMQYMVGLTLAGAGVGTADVAINWLCDEPARLSIVDERGRRWGIARAVIAKHAPHCTEVTYHRLEACVLRYHDPDERRSVDYQVACVQNGWPLLPNWIGLAQHALLPSLPTGRMSDTARSEMGVLERKFERPADDFLPHRLGRIRSLVPPVPEERATTMNDDGWLRIINSVGGTAGQVAHRNVGDDGFTESTPEAFARQLGRQARLHPGRFASLALRVAPTADPAYLDAIVHNIGDESPPNQEARDWHPAGDDAVVAVVEHVGYRTDFDLGRGVCWLIRKRPRAGWTQPCLTALRRYATEHPHPEEGEWVCMQGDQPDIETGALNCVRGSALDAIEAILFECPERLSEFLPTIRAAVSDPSPVVRPAAVGACLPILNSDRDLAVELFLGACETDDRVLATRRVNHFLSYTLVSHQKRLQPLLERMATSGHAAVAENGATWLAVNWIHDGLPRPLLESCLRGTAAQRRGVAYAAAHNIGDRQLAPRCAQLLAALIDDPDEGVQEAVADFLRDPKVLDHPDVVAVARRFATGTGLAHHPEWLVRTLVGRADSLVPVADLVFAVSERLTGDLAPAQGGSRQAHEFQEFVPVVLRLYEQAEQLQDAELRRRCLDWWDRLLESRVWGVREATAQLDGR